MWVQRCVAFAKPGLMAEAVAHLKTAPPEEGVTIRLLRPISGAEAGTKLIYEASFEDLDAQLASWADPQPPSEWMQRWIGLSQSRGIWELYRVQHVVEAEGTVGRWVDRRVRWVKDGWRGEAIRRWRHISAMPGPQTSMRLLTPWTGDKVGNILVVEQTFDSLTEWWTDLSEMLSTPEGRALSASYKTLELHEPTAELLRVVS